MAAESRLPNSTLESWGLDKRGLDLDCQVQLRPELKRQEGRSGRGSSRGENDRGGGATLSFLPL